jgi:intron-binding protein aquarius
LAPPSELAHSLPTAPLGENDVDSCQLAEHLFVQHVRPLFEAWLSLGGRTEYPFAAWERERRRLPPGAPLLPGDGGSDGTSDEARLEAARTLFTGVSAIFDELRDCRAFEIMRSATHRSDYLTTHQARIVAMTTTHAAIKRSQLAELGFGFDTVVMEEAAQVLEIDTFVSFMLQQRAARLKRITLIGDHRQLPPVVASAALRKHSHFDQSMFARLVRLGVPTTVLDAQGRARPSLARLFDWRYDGLRTLPALEQAAAVAGSPYALANAGLSHVMQFIDVPDYEGHGETAPVAHFFQNLGEAEYVVALYQYLRLLGHPAQSITLLTTYNGQKQLLNDVVNARCGQAWSPGQDLDGRQVPGPAERHCAALVGAHQVGGPFARCATPHCGAEPRAPRPLRVWTRVAVWRVRRAQACALAAAEQADQARVGAQRALWRCDACRQRRAS